MTVLGGLRNTQRWVTAWCWLGLITAGSLLAEVASRVASRLPRHWHAHVVPFIERRARARARMPARHPELLTRRLPRGHERWLAAEGAYYWPHAEYLAIVRGDYYDDEDG